MRMAVAVAEEEEEEKEIVVVVAEKNAYLTNIGRIWWPGIWDIQRRRPRKPDSAPIRLLIVKKRSGRLEHRRKERNKERREQ